jgi:hypothetical protein
VTSLNPLPAYGIRAIDFFPQVAADNISDMARTRLRESGSSRKWTKKYVLTLLMWVAFGAARPDLAQAEILTLSCGSNPPSSARIIYEIDLDNKKIQIPDIPDRKVIEVSISKDLISFAHEYVSNWADHKTRWRAEVVINRRTGTQRQKDLVWDFGWDHPTFINDKCVKIEPIKNSF